METLQARREYRVRRVFYLARCAYFTVWGRWSKNTRQNRTCDWPVINRKNGFVLLYDHSSTMPWFYVTVTNADTATNCKKTNKKGALQIVKLRTVLRLLRLLSRTCQGGEACSSTATFLRLLEPYLAADLFLEFCEYCTMK